MSFAEPDLTFSKTGPLETTRGAIGFTSFRRSFHLAISSSGLASAGMPTVRLERAGVLIRLEATRKPAG